jgi:hypothetical protein
MFIQYKRAVWNLNDENINARVTYTDKHTTTPVIPEQLYLEQATLIYVVMHRIRRSRKRQAVVYKFILLIHLAIGNEVVS